MHSSPSSNILQGESRPEYLRNEILADLFEASAQRAPNQVALVFEHRQLTYRELDAAADCVSAGLISRGVGPGRLVGLWMPRSIELLIAQLGIAKSGAGWLPFDADTPVERIVGCLADAKAAGIVSCAQLVPQLADIGSAVWQVESLLETTSTERRGSQVQGHNPAYVIYTSGSTGKPKGIEISQAAICHFLRSENSVLDVRATDRVYQGFSVAFDMSFEEIWISYLVGATLWLAPKELAVDPEALPRALAENNVTVLHAVPTMLAMFREDIPSLRIINLGGEMCPPTLVARWAKPGRQIFNTYGPTETTVSASLAELHPGEPVTIGRPLPNYGLMVIDPEPTHALTLLAPGELGELAITGPGVALGYLGRPDLTAEKFFANPWSISEHDRRLYRTGDLARIDVQGYVECLGRTDSQVKIRGFRVELGEIEAVLAQQEWVDTAAVLLRKEAGLDQLIAFFTGDADRLPTPAALRSSLAKVLPTYMVPSHYESLTEMPRLTSGKIDRNALKARPLAFVAVDSAASDAPLNLAEEALFGALTTLFPGQAIKRTLDFFSDLGGHSLFAARLASALRTTPRFAHVTVSDIYKNRQISRIADVLMEAPPATVAPDLNWTPPAAWRRWLCGAGQAAVIPIIVAVGMAQWLAPFFTYHYFTGDEGDSIPRAIAASLGVFSLTTLLDFCFAGSAYLLLARQLKPGRYPLWGLTYYRWWLADTILGLAPTYLLSGSSLYNAWLRALGANIGNDVVIGSMTLRAPHLLTIGAGSSIGNATNFQNARVQHGQIIIGAITLGENTSVGSYSVLEGNIKMGDYGHLDAQSALSDGMAIPARRNWSGSPARDTGAFDPASLRPRASVSNTRLTVEAIYFVFGALLISMLFFLPVFPSFMLIDWLDNYDRLPWLESSNEAFQLVKYFIMAGPAAAVMIVCTALLSAGIRWGLLPKLQPGSWPVHSNVYCRKWLVNQIQESSLHVLHGIYATVYAPLWYRLLGAKVGRDAEISTALGVVPDMLTLGDETFIADAVLLGDEQIDGGWMTMQATVISRRSFVGNGAYIADGTVLPENVLIGVASRAPENHVMREGDTWFGSPPINLPARETIQCFPEHLTFRPSPQRRLARGLIEAFRIIAPHALITAVGYTVVLDLMPLASAGKWWPVLYSLGLIGLAYGVGSFLFVVLLKWLLLGRYRQRSVPMWTLFVWLSEGLTNLYEGIAVPSFMNYLRGTPLLPQALRLLGCKMGTGIYLDTTDITEFDCVSIGDYSEINALACPQTHLFEDRVMKIDHINIGKRIYLGPRTTILYGAVIGNDARLGALTLVMKGEFIPAGSSWRGCPAAPGIF